MRTISLTFRKIEMEVHGYYDEADSSVGMSSQFTIDGIYIDGGKNLFELFDGQTLQEIEVACIEQIEENLWSHGDDED